MRRFDAYTDSIAHMNSVYRNLLFTFFFIFLSCSIQAQSQTKTLRLAIATDGPNNFRTVIDASLLSQGDVLVLRYNASFQPIGFRLKKGQALKVLQEFCSPKLIEKYDTFQCLERKIMDHGPDINTEAPTRGGYLDIPSQAMPEGPARGLMPEELEFIVLGPGQTDENWKGISVQNGEVVLAIRLKHKVFSSQQQLIIQTKTACIPFEREMLNKTRKQLSMQLFMTDTSRAFMLAEAVNLKGRMHWPNEVLEWPLAWHDSLEQAWNRESKPVLLYLNNVSPLNPNKCSPCMSAPPGWDDWLSLGYKGQVPEHLYLSAFFIPATKQQYTVVRETKTTTFSLVFEVHHLARVFFQCEEYQVYLQAAEKRKKQAKLNLRACLSLEE